MNIGAPPRPVVRSLAETIIVVGNRAGEHGFAKTARLLDEALLSLLDEASQDAGPSSAACRRSNVEELPTLDVDDA